ncbi:MFS transporter [Streptomyces sp. AJS327]|nr:MFS transporter [Streptomyces sp. AJS327]MBA0050844.1 MFS transporter [Streptomyces sp. AJS327]
MRVSGAVPDRPARLARRAVAAVFAVHGTVSGGFATRIPWLREHLGLSPGWLGLALVFMTVGASAAMPLAAGLAHRLGPRRSLRLLTVVCCAALPLPALAPRLGWLCLALLVYGAGLGLLDVAMNDHGVRVEHAYGRSVMSGLHGMWSAGALLGGAGGAVAAQGGLPAPAHLSLVAPALAVAGVVACRWVPGGAAAPGGEGATGTTGPEGATGTSGASAAEGGEGAAPAPPRFAPPTRGALAVGLVGFCAVFAEGASMDWSGIYLRDVTGAGPGLAAAAYTAFACTMAIARFTGDAAVRRFGAVRTVRASGGVAALGGALVVAAESPPLAVAGFALVGVGIAVVVPLCFAAAGRTAPEAPARAIAGVATLAYASGLAAPAAVGWIAETTSLTFSFGLVTALLFGLVAGAGVLRPAPRAVRPEPGATPGESGPPTQRTAASRDVATAGGPGTHREVAPGRDPVAPPPPGRGTERAPGQPGRAGPAGRTPPPPTGQTPTPETPAPDDGTG